MSGPDLKDLLAAVLARGVPFRFRALGMSMDPFIKDGDVITVGKVKEDNLRIGDVVAYCSPPDGHLVVHRIVRRSPGGLLVIRGDANDEADAVALLTDVLGRVKLVQRLGRRVYLGMGPERFVLAHVSRRGLLRPLIARVRVSTNRLRHVLRGVRVA